MKAGKKISMKSQRRSVHHNNAIGERKRKGISEPEKGFRAPGSMNKTKN